MSRRIALVFSIAVLAAVSSLRAQDCCCGSTSPLVLDLNGDGIHTTDLFYPVVFDLDGDGDLEWAAWTSPYTEDGFLWLDRNRNGDVDDGRELFGTATVLPGGGHACNGFEALAVFDRMEHGGNADGRIGPGDQIWGKLQVWVDRNHDAVASPDETSRLPRLGIRSLDLEYAETTEVDGNMNAHTFQGTYLRRIRHRGRWLTERLAIHDVYFQTGLTTPPASN